MVERLFKQMIIHIKYKGKVKSITAESIKPTLKQDEELYYGTNSPNAYGRALDKKSYEFQMSGISPSFYKYFADIFAKQDTPEGEYFTATTYGYNKKHETERRDSFLQCSITEISNETAEPFDVKFSALGWFGPS